MIETDAEALLALDDTTTAQQPPDAPLEGLTEFYLKRLLLPSRFAARHLAAAQHALLPNAPSAFGNGQPAPAIAVASSLRAGMDHRISELEASAAAASGLHASVNAPGGVAQALGESLLSFAVTQKVAAHEVLAIAAIDAHLPDTLPAAAHRTPHDTPHGTPPAALVVLTRARLSLLHQPLTASERGGAQEHAHTHAPPPAAKRSSKTATTRPLVDAGVEAMQDAAAGYSQRALSASGLTAPSSWSRLLLHAHPHAPPDASSAAPTACAPPASAWPHAEAVVKHAMGRSGPAAKPRTGPANRPPPALA